MKPRKQVARLLKTKHFCILPWVHLHATSLGYMAPCCQQDPELTGYGSLNTHSFEELWQGEAIRNFRIKMLNNEMDERCSNCYTDEKAFGTSTRTRANAKYRKYMDWVADTTEDGYAPQAKPVDWDIRFSNLCNLRCRTCHFSSSSGWYHDETALGKLNPHTTPEVIQGIKDTDAFLACLEPYFRHAEYLYFAGGEPLLFKENLLILEKLDSLKKYDVALAYNTNLTQLGKNKRYLELWKKFTNLVIMVSLDGSHERGEYLRKGLVWDDVVRNLQMLKDECPHAKIRVFYTVSAFNILHAPDFHKDMILNSYIKPEQLFFIILYRPDYYNIKILPTGLKAEATQKIKQHIRWLLARESRLHIATDHHIIGQWKACLDYMNSGNWNHLIPKFLDCTHQLDNLRNEKCLEVFPELGIMFDEAAPST